jgi:DNA gyrase subunit A
LFVTTNGLVKKTSLEEYVKTKKKTGIAAISIKDGDELAAVSLIKDEQLILVTKNGMAIRFDSKEVSPTSRATSGVKGINLTDDDVIVAALPVRNQEDKLAIFAHGGMAKKIPLSELPIQKRAGKGLMCYKPTDSTGDVSTATLVEDADSVLILGDKSSICIEAAEIPLLTRPSVGNLVIKNSKILSVSKV